MKSWKQTIHLIYRLPNMPVLHNAASLRSKENFRIIFISHQENGLHKKEWSMQNIYLIPAKKPSMKLRTKAVSRMPRILVECLKKNIVYHRCSTVEKLQS